MSNVAIVILNFNGRSLLAECLASLSRLTLPTEIVVADNGSTDDSLAYLRERHASIRLLNLEKNWGFAEGYNRALAQIEQPWLVLLNNDATLAPDWLEQLLAVAGEKPQAAILGGKLLFKQKTGEAPLVQCAGASFTDAGTAFEIGWGRPDPVYRQMFAARFLPEGTQEEWRAFDELQRRSTSSENAWRFVREFSDIDIAGIAPQVSVPTLVACARNEPDNVFEQSRELASLIPGSALLPLDSCNHLLPERDPAWPRFLGAMEAFLADTTSDVAPSEGGGAGDPLVHHGVQD